MPYVTEMEVKQQLSAFTYTGWVKLKHPNTKITISVQCKNTFTPNLPRSFITQYFVSLLNSAPFSQYSAKWNSIKFNVW